MTNPIDTAALRRAWGETTQGVWKPSMPLKAWDGTYSLFEVHWSDDGECVAEIVHGEANARFIALAHREWPALLDRIDALEALAKANNDLARMEVAHRKKLAFQRAELANAMEALTSQYGHRLPADFLSALTEMLMRHGEEARTALGDPS